MLTRPTFLKAIVAAALFPVDALGDVGAPAAAVGSPIAAAARNSFSEWTTMGLQEQWEPLPWQRDFLRAAGLDG